MYPIMLSLADKRVLVVGGGSVALRKVEGLLSEKAKVTVIALEPVAALKDLADKGDIHLERRSYNSKEATGFSLVFAATDDREVNRQVSEDGQAAGVWINVADDPELCTFQLPARMKRGPLQIAVASAGQAPFVVRRIRQLLERRFGHEWAEWMEAAARFRNSVRELKLSAQEQEKRFELFFSGTVDESKLTVRVPAEDEEASWTGVDRAGINPAPTAKRDDAESNGIPTADQGDEKSNVGAGFIPAHDATQKLGLVSLVGAGPGDPGLLTLRGRQRLLAADAVVCDRLAMTSLPCDLDDRVEIRFVGKTAGYHPVPQDEINALIIRLSKEGKRVVRLKGGDPFIFGRGGEEAVELSEAGIPFEVVPCVTAGVSVPTYAGIPITFRNEVVRVTLVTAHEAKKQGGPQVRWDLLATDPHSMLLGYMGVTNLPNVVRQLLDNGMDPDTPAALIARGTTSRQQVVASTVSRLSEDVTKVGLEPPALFAIGSTIKHRQALDWFGERPLLGERVVITTKADRIKEELELSGVEIVEVTAPITRAARIVMDALPLTGCILTCADDADVIDEERDSPSWAQNWVAWCLSSDAASRARELGWQNIEEIPASKSGSPLVATMIKRRSHPK
ncbi:MAG: uroporphyrinogen-III C-methyltransferase [Proteobacteria bacterium]|nr:uroporphyrinogen-III C-methyltransferase [Pseudomonadota bacterium]